MKKLFFTLFTTVALLATGCTFDDTEIWNEINGLKSRVDALEQLCNQMNTNITSLQTIVEALQKNDYVTGIAPIQEGEQVIGYTIIFAKSDPITIHLSNDASAPQIGVKKDADGVYYWTLDGEWLLDDDGNKVKAQGADGDNGNTPKLKIENGYWYVSYDNGETWSEVGKATSDEGDSMFDEVTYDDDYVYITLNDGTTLVMPRSAGPVPTNQIWYTSTNGNVVAPRYTNVFGANIVSNVYEDGKGVITFDGDITSIGNYAFYNCTYLSNIALPDSVTSIGEYAFGSCTSLTSITIPDSVTSIGSNAFSGCTSLGSFYGKYASADNRCLIVDGELKSFARVGLTSYTIPSGVTSIGKYAFRGCSSLESITIPDGVTSIGYWAFYDCWSLTSITLPNSVSSIENNPFYFCRSLTSFYGKYASADNRCLIVDGELKSFAPAGLTSYTIPSGVTSIGREAFRFCRDLTSVTIPNSVTSIGDMAFCDCRSLTSITIPNSVTSIGTHAFYVCESLTSITIPDSVTSIGKEAFYGCLLLESITIPDSVTTIGNNAFLGCTSLTTVYSRNTTPPSAGNKVFDYCDSLSKIYVPTSSVSAYQSASGWSDYASKIEGYIF